MFTTITYTTQSLGYTPPGYSMLPNDKMTGWMISHASPPSKRRVDASGGPKGPSRVIKISGFGNGQRLCCLSK